MNLRSSRHPRNFWLLLLCLAASAVFAANVYGPVKFHGDVSVAAFTNAPVVVSATPTYAASGIYTNGAYTNYYRLSGTNLAGRTGATTNLVVATVGSASASNSIVLTWQRLDGVAAHVVERSLDAGSNWTNWIAVSASTTNWTDYGTNTWTAGAISSLYSLIASPSVPWGTSADLVAYSNYVAGLGLSTGTVTEAYVQAATQAVGATSAALFVTKTGAAFDGNVDFNSHDLQEVSALYLGASGWYLWAAGGMADTLTWANGMVSYSVWHSGNDGTGSGLDADTVDGVHAASFYLASNPSNFVGPDITNGLLRADGTVPLAGTLSGAGNSVNGIGTLTATNVALKGYLSNDGDSEGLSISSGGDATFAHANNADYSLTINNYSTNSAHRGLIKGYKHGGAGVAAPNGASAFDFIGGFFDGFNLLNTASMNFFNESTITSNNAPTAWGLYTGSSSRSERMRITSAGLVGINDTTPSAHLDVNGHAQVQSNLTVRGSLTLGASNLVLNTGSYLGTNGIYFVNGTTTNWLLFQ